MLVANWRNLAYSFRIFSDWPRPTHPNGFKDFEPEKVGKSDLQSMQPEVTYQSIPKTKAGRKGACADLAMQLTNLQAGNQQAWFVGDNPLRLRTKVCWMDYR